MYTGVFRTRVVRERIYRDGLDVSRETIKTRRFCENERGEERDRGRNGRRSFGDEIGACGRRNGVLADRREKRGKRRVTVDCIAA